MPPPDSSTEVWTVGRIIDWTTAHLRKHGSDTPRLEAEILLAHVRRQHHHDVRLAHGVRDRGYVQTGLFRLGPGA